MFSKVDEEISKPLANLILRYSDLHTSLIKDLTCKSHAPTIKASNQLTETKDFVYLTTLK